jgi:hypothetical protein
MFVAKLLRNPPLLSGYESGAYGARTRNETVNSAGGKLTCRVSSFCTAILYGHDRFSDACEIEVRTRALEHDLPMKMRVGSDQIQNIELLVQEGVDLEKSEGRIASKRRSPLILICFADDRKCPRNTVPHGARLTHQSANYARR